MKGKWIALIIVALIVVAAAGAFGGYTTGVNAGKAQAVAATNAFLAGRGFANAQGGAAFGGQGASGRQFSSDNFATGQVEKISGDTIQLSTAQAVVTVKLNNQTQIQKMSAGAVSDIQTGERITVQGTRGSDGAITAQSIQIGGSGFRGGGAPNGQPRQGGGAPNSQPGQGTGASRAANNTSN
jgi:Tfp pilus assembly protein PilE